MTSLHTFPSLIAQRMPRRNFFSFFLKRKNVCRFTHSFLSFRPPPSPRTSPPKETAKTKHRKSDWFSVHSHSALRFGKVTKISDVTNARDRASKLYRNRGKNPVFIAIPVRRNFFTSCRGTSAWRASRGARPRWPRPSLCFRGG